MTIAAVWVRTLSSGAEELVFCSDSRLSGQGARFDQGQKTFRLSRTDAAICFAGGTHWAYPMVVAAINAVDVHIPSKTRALGLPQFKNHLLNILNQMQREVHNFVTGENIPNVTFLFGGYDSWTKCFRIWRLKFDEIGGRFVAEERGGSNGFGGLGKIEIAGDPEWTEVVRERLKVLTQSRYGLNMREPETSRFNWEPFEVIRDLVRATDPNISIGGAVQLVKVYQYLNSTDVGVFWPNIHSKQIYLGGRPLQPYEKAFIKSILEPDALVSTWANGGIEEALASMARALTTARDRESELDSDISEQILNE